MLSQRFSPSMASIVDPVSLSISASIRFDGDRAAVVVSTTVARVFWLVVCAQDWVQTVRIERKERRPLFVMLL